MGILVLLFFVSRGLVSVSVFFLTRFLSLASFGNVVLARNLVDLIFVLFNVGLPYAFVRYFSECHADPKRLYGTTIIPVCVFNALGAVIILSMHGWFGHLFHLDAEFNQCMICVAFIAIFQTFSQLVLLDFQARENFKGYLVAQTTVTVGTLIPMVLAGYFLRTATGAMAGLLLGYVLTAIPFAPAIRARLGGLHEFDLSLLKRMLGFGIPLLLTNVSYLAVSFSDRFVIEYFKGIREVAVYAVPGYLCAALAMMFTAPINSALAPQVFRLHREGRNEEIGRLVRGSFRLYLLAVPLALFGIIATSPYLARLLGKKELMEGLKVLPWMGPAFALFILYSIANVILSEHGRTGVIGIAFIVACVTNIGMNIVLVPRLGYMGAAYSSFVSYCLIFTITYVAASRYCRLDRRVWLVAPLWILLLSLQTRWTASHPGALGSFLVAAAVSAIYLGAAGILRIIHISDILVLWKVLKNFRNKQFDANQPVLVENA
jgi:O-antigen/teichoic acid export membrane protein